MGLLNYSTTVNAAKTITQIQNDLAKCGANKILSEYKDGGIEALSFMVEGPNGSLAFRLPSNVEAVLRILVNQAREERIPKRYACYEQAVKVAWRIVRDWIKAQLAIIEAEMVTVEEVFLPYLLDREGKKTLYQSMMERGFLLPEGRETD